MVGVFRVKNHDFTPKNHIFFNFRPPPPPPPPGSAPVHHIYLYQSESRYKITQIPKIYMY